MRRICAKHINIRHVLAIRKVKAGKKFATRVHWTVNALAQHASDVRDGATPAILDAVVKSAGVEIVVVIGQRRVACRSARCKGARQPRFGQPSTRELTDVAKEKEQRVSEIGRQCGDPRDFRLGLVMVFDGNGTLRERGGGWERGGVVEGRRRRRA